MIVNGGDGREDGDGVYVKPTLRGEPYGSVYVVLGSSSWLQSGGTRDHPAMVTAVLARGFVVFTVDGTRLDCSFIDDALVERDRFTIIKDEATPVEKKTIGEIKYIFE